MYNLGSRHVLWWSIAPYFTSYTTLDDNDIFVCAHFNQTKCTKQNVPLSHVLLATCCWMVSNTLKSMTWNTSWGKEAIVSNSCLLTEFPMPIDSSKTPEFFSNLASVAVSVGLFDSPSVRTIAILGTSGRDPLAAVNIVSLASCKATSVAVPPSRYGVVIIPWNTQTKQCTARWRRHIFSIIFSIAFCLDYWAFSISVTVRQF